MYHVLVLGVGPVVLPVVQRDGHLRVNRVHDHDRQRVEPLREERPEGGLLVLGAVVGPGNERASERAGQSASRGWLGWLFAARFTQWLIGVRFKNKKLNKTVTGVPVADRELAVHPVPGRPVLEVEDAHDGDDHDRDHEQDHDQAHCQALPPQPMGVSRPHGHVFCFVFKTNHITLSY